MRDWKKTLISPSQPIAEAMRIIDTSALQIALVIDENSRLVGVVTDGDIRRGILKGMKLEQPVSSIMSRNFTSAKATSSREEIIELMKNRDLHQIPVLDEQGCVIDLKILVDLINIPRTDNWVVLMAGGLGTRLQPLTYDFPKPLLKVGNKSILEIILDSFIKYGFKRYFIAVNYKAKMIEDHFGDGSRWGIQIEYLRENKELGTAGALSMLPDKPKTSLIVMNADLMTKVNFQQLLDFHSAHRASGTMCVQNYHFQVPYGVVNINQQYIIGIDEKPSHRFFVNAGIYVLEPNVLSFLQPDSYLDMTSLFEKVMSEGLETVAFPLREYWLDIGRISDYEKANGDYWENMQMRPDK